MIIVPGQPAKQERCATDLVLVQKFLPQPDNLIFPSQWIYFKYIHILKYIANTLKLIVLSVDM